MPCCAITVLQATHFGLSNLQSNDEKKLKARCIVLSQLKYSSQFENAGIALSNHEHHQRQAMQLGDIVMCIYTHVEHGASIDKGKT